MEFWPYFFWMSWLFWALSFINFLLLYFPAYRFIQFFVIFKIFTANFLKIFGIKYLNFISFAFDLIWKIICVSFWCYASSEIRENFTCLVFQRCVMLLFFIKTWKIWMWWFSCLSFETLKILKKFLSSFVGSIFACSYKNINCWRINFIDLFSVYLAAIDLFSWRRFTKNLCFYLIQCSLHFLYQKM